MLEQTTIIHSISITNLTYFEDIKYTLDEEFLEEFIKQIKGKITD